MGRKVVINVCHGGFGLSVEAYERLIELGMDVVPFNPETHETRRVIQDLVANPDDGNPLSPHQLARLYNSRYTDNWIRSGGRDHPLVVRVVEELGEEADGRFAKLKVIEIPDNVEWAIEEYDGAEWIAEAHRTWR